MVVGLAMLLVDFLELIFFGAILMLIAGLEPAFREYRSMCDHRRNGFVGSVSFLDVYRNVFTSGKR